MVEEQNQSETITQQSEADVQNASASSDDEMVAGAESDNSATASVPEEQAPELSNPDNPPQETEDNSDETDNTAELSEQAELELAIETLQQENAALKQQLEGKIQQNQSLKAQLVRNSADFDNFRKRTHKETQASEERIKRQTISELLGVIDNFERARTQIKPSNEGELSIHKSYQGVYRLLVDSLKRIGVSAMKPEGEPFDPNLHEAVMREETDEYPEGAVIEQLQRGYLLGDRVLRHAMVKVATPKSTVITSEEEVSEADTELQETGEN